MDDHVEQYDPPPAPKISQEDLDLINKQKSIRFKANLTLLVVFFLLITGFLLTRLVLDQQSHCQEPPIELASRRGTISSIESGCWHPKIFDKAVIIIIDALRYDFTVPFDVDHALHFHNSLKVLHETAVKQPQNAFLTPFIADPPTTTLQRLKGLTTGTLPTFIDAGSNFAGTAIEEDNLVLQLHRAGKRLVHLGDDTWHSLFPGYFDANLTHAYDSFNVWDLHTVDQGVTKHLMPLLQPSNAQSWDVIFGHYLGVDHAGHRYGPDHTATQAKLEEMDQVLRTIIDTIDDQTLLVVMGDHGMDVKGDHGGESDDEVEAALWMYTKRNIFGHSGKQQPPRTAKERPVAQIDLVPTLSLLLGMPIPFNNLGSPITDAFAGPGSIPDWQNLANVNALTAAQISRYQAAYAEVRRLDSSIFSPLQSFWQQGINAMEISSWGGKLKHPEKAFQHFKNYQAQNLSICRGLWAQFDVPSMVLGITILAASLMLLIFFARSKSLDRATFAVVAVSRISIGGVLGLIAMLGRHWWLTRALSLDAGLIGGALGGLGGFVVATVHHLQGSPVPRSVWSWLAIVFTLGQSVGFASNSYTIWEDEILGFILNTFALIALFSSIRQQTRALGISQCLVFALATRLASFSRLCREEQMPYCRSTFYASSTSSTSAPWQLLLPVATAAILPSIVQVFYRQTGSYEGMADVFTNTGLRVCLASVSLFWILDAADNENWALVTRKQTLQTMKIVLARLILGVSLIVGPVLFVKSQPCISIRVTDKDVPDAQPRTMRIYGSRNAHGTRYFMAVVCLLVALMLLQKPMGNMTLALLVVQILLLGEIVHINGLRYCAISPVVLAALGNFYFFKTGHQATLASIQWDAAFIPLTTIRYPWSPMLVVANTYAAQIMTAAAVPLVVLWRHPPRKSNLLSNVAQALATFLIYHATIGLATTIFAAYLRRHLMLFRIFSPRFMTAAAALLLVDLVGSLIGLGALWWNTVSVATIFGWG